MTPRSSGPAPPSEQPAAQAPGPPGTDAVAPIGPAPSDTRSLVVVSNRLPFTAERRPDGIVLRRSPGGLVAALEPVLTERGGVWVGWTGVAADDAEVDSGLALPDDGPVRYRPVALSAHEVTQFYGGFANRTVWPLFHYFVGHTTIDDATWQTYERVNARFAQAAVDASSTDSLIWVHDYQLLRVPHYVRRLAAQRRLAFFLHIPFPAADVFRVLPWSRALLRGMLAADLVAFHVPSYVEHFLTCAERLLGSEVDRAAGVVRFEGREVAVQAHPIGIDVQHVEQLAAQAPAPPPREAAGGRVADILGVDRLDYSKGINQRLLAVERLLERHPGYRGRAVFTQVMVPSRERVAEYGQLKREIDETVGRINGRFSEPGWAPIRYLVRSLPPAELAALYRQADVALVTPLRDGMNLVAKEYAAAQLDNDGVLVLSEMAGAAEELQEALVVNPFDIDAVAEALHRALAMPADERRARMSALRDRVRASDVHAWVRRLLEAVDVASRRARTAVASPVEVTRRILTRWLGNRPTVALFLDYDGTLTPIVQHPADAALSDATRQVLDQAARTPTLDTVIVSGRSIADLQERVGIAGLTYVGDHGFEIEGPGISFRHEARERVAEVLSQAAEALTALAVPGAWVERKGATLAYHLRGVAPAERRAAERAAEKVLRHRRLRVIPGKITLEGRPPVDWHKGRAVLYVLVHRHGADWPSRVRALYLGDDTTDEDAFRSLHGIGRSIRIGPPPITGQTHAEYALPDPDAVTQLLRWLASGDFTYAATRVPQA
jgi:trehalose 6-phosphate synthase/phosphatase